MVTLAVLSDGVLLLALVVVVVVLLVVVAASPSFRGETTMVLWPRPFRPVFIPPVFIPALLIRPGGG